MPDRAGAARGSLLADLRRDCGVTEGGSVGRGEGLLKSNITVSVISHEKSVVSEILPKLARDGTRRGGARPNSGRPKGIPNRWPREVAAEIRRLGDEVERLRQQRRNEHETLPALLRRITSIERKLDLIEAPIAPRPTRRHPTGL